MFLANKIGWAGIALTLLTTGMSVQGVPRSAAGSEFNKEGDADQNEIKKMQETLRNKGHHRGKVDGVFGLRTRASIRAYQKAENFPISGEVDAWTADGLGIRPESIWDNSRGAGGDVGRGIDRAGGDMNRGK